MGAAARCNDRQREGLGLKEKNPKCVACGRGEMIRQPLQKTAKEDSMWKPAWFRRCSRCKETETTYVRKAK